MAAGKKTGKISAGMLLSEVASKHPKALEVMLRHGMHCMGCHMAAHESIEQGAAAHGIEGKNLDNMLKEMNRAA